MVIEHIWFYPPLAFARLGSSETPLECFYWGEDDNLPRGSGKTTILPGLTLVVAKDGTVSSYIPDEIRFKDGDRFRPVCPFFELHASWRDQKGVVHEGEVTESLLKHDGLTPADLVWEISVANIKPFNMTGDPDTRVEAHVTMRGDDVTSKELHGTAPITARNPLVPVGQFIPLGHVQLTKPNSEFSGLRLRFTPAKGCFYGPTNLKERWKTVHLEDRYLFLNKDSSWCQWKPSPDDPRGTPGGQYAQDDDSVSYGMVDDVCDGIIRCRMPRHDSSSDASTLVAQARISVAPPDYAPDRRHPVSLADGLKDRVDRESVFNDEYFRDEAVVDAELRELMQRIYETAAINNVDVFNNRVNIQENPATAIQLGIPFRQFEFIAFPAPAPLDKRPLPLSDTALEYHRRFQVLAVLLDIIRKQPDLFRLHVREPLSRELFFDNKMPAVMRGPSGDPLTLTRRQYEFLMRWISKRSGGGNSGAKP
jgi:hypothetical protein